MKWFMSKRDKIATKIFCSMIQSQTHLSACSETSKALGKGVGEVIAVASVDYTDKLIRELELRAK